jgi:hypothetical protein
MLDFVMQHQFGIAVAAYWIFSAAVSSLPDPAPNGNRGYLWLYRFCHTTAGNLTTAFAGKIPGLKVMSIVLMLSLLFSTSACAAHYTIHPGALNITDSAAYDTLFVAETVIEQARQAYQDGTIPPGSKDALNTLIQAYNVARESWLTYRDAIATNTPTDLYFEKLAKNLTDLTTAIRNLQNVKEVKP